MNLMHTPDENDDLWEECAMYCMESVFDKMILSKQSKQLMQAFFQNPLGQWVNLCDFFRQNNIPYPNPKIQIFACWLNELNGTSEPYRIIVFHEYEFMQSRLATVHLAAFDISQ